MKNQLTNLKCLLLDFIQKLLFRSVSSLWKNEAYCLGQQNYHICFTNITGHLTIGVLTAKYLS